MNTHGLKFDHVVVPRTRPEASGFGPDSRFLVLDLDGSDPDALAVFEDHAIQFPHLLYDCGQPDKYILDAARHEDRYVIGLYILRLKGSNPARAEFLEGLLSDFPANWPIELAQHPAAGA